MKNLEVGLATWYIQSHAQNFYDGVIVHTQEALRAVFVQLSMTAEGSGIYSVAWTSNSTTNAGALSRQAFPQFHLIIWLFLQWEDGKGKGITGPCCGQD